MDIIENSDHLKNLKEIPSNSKANAALTLGIIGTALSVIGPGVVNMLTGKGNNSSSTTDADLYNERKQWKDYLAITTGYYQGELNNTKQISQAFFDAYKRDVDNSFMLYKGQRDSSDALAAAMNAGFTNERNERDALRRQIFEVDKKVDMMAAVRPYQDALIDKKIDNNALIAAYELQKRTCRMIQGELVLPSTPTVTGYPSYTACGCPQTQPTTATT